MDIGDRIKVTSTKERSHFYAGDKATLTHQDSDGDWWADFDNRSFFDGDCNFCLQEGITKLELIDV